MIGTGSRARFSQAAFTMIDVKFARFFKDSRAGVDLGIALMFPIERDARIAFAQLEVAGDWLLAGGSWGSLVAGVGFGGDVGRYWWEGRGYPLILVRERTWLSRKVKLELESRTLPVAVDAKLLPMFEQRFELAVGVGLFAFGLRFAWTRVSGDRPARDYDQHELGAFVGLGL